MLVSSASAIRLSLQPSLDAKTSAFSRIRALVKSCAVRLPLRINSSSWPRSSLLNLTTYFLTVVALAATNHLHRRLATAWIQKDPAKAMTRGTSEARMSEQEGDEPIDRTGPVSSEGRNKFQGTGRFRPFDHF